MYFTIIKELKSLKKLFIIIIVMCINFHLQKLQTFVVIEILRLQFTLQHHLV